MGRAQYPLTAADMARARKLRKDGASWKRISAGLGCHEETIRRRMDGDYKLRRQLRYAGPQSFIRSETRVPKADAERAIGSIPADTRSVLSRFMGDPLPGRSALDQRGLR